MDENNNSAFVNDDDAQDPDTIKKQLGSEGVEIGENNFVPETDDDEDGEDDDAVPSEEM